MEFKYSKGIHITSEEQILIESQWNLNEVSIANKAQTEMILIESQWNLNCDQGEYRITAGEILIESQWNLNLNGAKIKLKRWRKY